MSIITIDYRRKKDFLDITKTKILILNLNILYLKMYAFL